MNMHEIFTYTIVSVILISLISIIGIFTILLNKEKLHRFLIYFISFSAGALLGDAFLHLLPEALEKSEVTVLSTYIILGIILFFGIEKFIQWRHCHHSHSDEIKKHGHTHRLAYINLIGDAAHNFIDGLIIAGSYLISIPIGLTTTLAVALHEIPQEIGDFAVLLHSGLKAKKALAYNLLSASLAIIGAIVALFLSRYINSLNVILSGITIGAFIYIANSDLIPELTKETNTERSFFQLLSFLGGILVMVILL